MVQHSSDDYGSQGSVPYSPSVAPTGLNAPNMSQRANPEDMGAAIGAGVSKVGEASDKLANEYGGMVNETLMTNADAALAQKIGQIKGAYLQNTGLAAAAAFPQYQTDLEAARLQARGNLPVGAAHGFDMLSMRTIANHMADGSTYAASQLRQANIDSGTNLQNANVQAVLDPDVAKDPERVQWHQDSAIHGVQMTLDENHPGLKTDPETGAINFDESKPEGRALKAQYDARVDDVITQTQTNRFNTLAKGDVLGAFGIYQQERSSLPRPAQVQLDAMFEPRVFNAHVDNSSTQVIGEANHDYANKLYNPQSLSARNNNPGNLRDTATGQFKVFDTPEAGAAAMQADLTAKVSGNSSAMEKNFGKGYSPTLSNIISTYAPANENNTAAYIDTVSKETAFAPNQVLSVTDIPKLQAAMTKVEAGGSGANVQPQKSYATNPDGSKLTTADYYRTHSEDIIARADAQSERDMPGDLAYKRAMRETVSNYMNKVISNQAGQYTLDNKNVVRGITGELTKGKPPETEAELRAIPGMDDLLNRVSAQDPKFTEGIPTMIAKMARRNDVTNSANGYDTIIRTLQPQDDDHPNHIKTQTQLDSLLGKGDGTGINMKDYNDAKPATELPTTIKEPILKHMIEITNANGNLDGKGQQRAVQWYNQVMDAYKKNESLGDKKDQNFADNIGKPDGPIYAPPAPSRMTQISNWAKEVTGLGHVLVKNADGQQGYIPAGNVEKALKLGYTKVE